MNGRPKSSNVIGGLLFLGLHDLDGHLRFVSFGKELLGGLVLVEVVCDERGSIRHFLYKKENV